jgi:hypothetical protein
MRRQPTNDPDPGQRTKERKKEKKKKKIFLKQKGKEKKKKKKNPRTRCTNLDKEPILLGRIHGGTFFGLLIEIGKQQRFAFGWLRVQARTALTMTTCT